MSSFLSEAVREYQAWSPQSGSRAERAQSIFPGGDTRRSAHFNPYPLFVESADGAQLIDADGHSLIDFMNNFTSLLHGHGHPATCRAVSDQMLRGSAHAAPTDSQVALGQLLRERVPSMDLLRFAASGSEATLLAIRCARSVTGRDKIMKMEGGYHGSYELAEVSMIPFPHTAGPEEEPTPLPIDDSHPSSLMGDVVVCPYNNPQAAREIIRRHADELAAVILEPMQGSMGMIPATSEFLQTIREETEAHGIVMVLDEVITLRLSEGGMQAIHNVTPDLTCLGKIIGGGLPIGAIGGREDLMNVFHPAQDRAVLHSSTFSGNALSMSAGIAAMQAADSTVLERLNALGDQLRNGFNKAFENAGIRGQATGMGSLVNLHFTDAPLHNPREVLLGMIQGNDLGTAVHLKMLQQGICSASRHMYCISTPMNKEHVDIAVSALENVLIELKPGVESEAPDLLKN